MKAEELRIGNYVNVPRGEQCPFRIDLFNDVSSGIGKFGMICDKNIHPLTWYLQYLHPIPISDEFLLKNNFSLTEHCLYELFTPNGHKITFKCKELFCYVDDIGLDHIKSVHDYQNLWKSLTGTELEIKWT